MKTHNLALNKNPALFHNTNYMKNRKRYTVVTIRK